MYIYNIPSVAAYILFCGNPVMDSWVSHNTCNNPGPDYYMYYAMQCNDNDACVIWCQCAMLTYIYIYIYMYICTGCIKKM